MDPVLKQAFSNRWLSLRRKAPIIIAAALACYGLYYLDDAKRKFDKERSKPIPITESVKSKLGDNIRPVAGVNTWNEIEKFIVTDQYSAESDFINKIAGRISAEMDAKEFAAREEFKKCVAHALEPPAEDDTQVRKTRQECTDGYLADNQAAYTEAEKRIANVYRYIKDLNLKDMAGVTPSAKGYVESSLQPILNDQGGLHIIYQILRIALIVVIVFALISVVVLLLTTVMLSDGVKVLTEHATSFIGLGKGSIAPVAKGAAISIAALGLGGALVAGASTGPGDSEPATYQRENNALRSPNVTPPTKGSNKESTRPNVTHHDGSNIQYEFGPSANSYDYSQHSTFGGNDPTQTPINFSPEINVPQLRLPRTGPIESNLSLDADTTGAITAYLNSLRVLNEQLSVKIAAVASPQSKDDIRVSNLLKNAEKDPLLILDAGKGPISDSISRVETNLNPIKDVATSLADFQVTSLDTPANPNERPFLVRLLRGPNKYFVSKRSVEQLEEIKKGRQALRRTEIQQVRAGAGDDSAQKPEIAAIIAHLEWKIAADDVILQAVKGLYLDANKPADADTFYNNLQGKLTGLLWQSKILPEKHPNTLERLKYWRDTILTYTRID